MNNESNRRIAACAVDFALPRYAELPSVGLYLDQTVQYVNGYFRAFPGVELTASMVSNYVKQRLIPAPQKKVYTAEQLARLMFIAAVKPVVPLEGLRLMFGIQEGSYALCTAYDYFCDEFENMLFAAFGVAPAAQGLGETRSAAKDLLRNTVSAIVNKIYLDRYLSDYQDRLAQERSSSEAVPQETERLCAEKK